MTWKDWFQRNLGVVVLFLLFNIALFYGMHLIHIKADDSSRQWIEGIVGNILAAIFTLLVGGNSRKGDAGSGTTISEMKGDINTQGTTIKNE